VAEQDHENHDGNQNGLLHLDGANADEAFEEEERFEEKEEGEGLALPYGVEDS
jgi:hypothetical protein